MCVVCEVCVRVVCDVCEGVWCVVCVCHTMTRSLPEIQFHKKFHIVGGWLHRGPNKTTEVS